MATRLRIAIVAPTLRILGGQAVQAHRLLKAWEADPEIDAELVPINPRPPVLRRFAELKFIRTILTQLTYWPTLLSRLRHVDVVHVFSASYFSFLLAPMPAVLISRLLRKPVILNYRSGEAPDHLKRSRIARLLLRRVDVNVVPSAFLQEVFARFHLASEIIPNIVDLDLFAFRVRRNFAPRLLSTRNFEPIYNVACTLEAFEIVLARYPDATLTLVGAGSQAELLRREVASRQIRNVRFAGAVPPGEIWRYYADADIYLQTPEIDNMPTSVLEAFASGCAVVSTRAGGLPAILIDEVHGYLVPCGDAAAAADRVIRLVESPESARQIAARARETCERYRWTSVRGRWLELYRRIAQPRPPLQRRITDAAGEDSRPAATERRPPLRVALVAPTLRILGGHAVQADRLLTCWAGDGEVRAALLPINPVLPAPFTVLSRVKFVRTAVTQALYWPLLFRQLRSADVAHVFSASYWSFLLSPLPAIVVARLLGKPLIVNYRSGEAPDHLKRSAIARLALRRADLNVVPSKFLQDVFSEFHIPTEIIPDIVDLNRFAFRRREVFQPRLLCTRNFEPLYNIGCTLRAFAIVQLAYPDASLTLVGSGSQFDALQRLAYSLKLRNVRFVGAVAPDDIWRYYADADIYLQTPDIDNMPASVIEAFASGCVVVSTDAGGVPTILIDGVHGYIVPCGDYRAAAERTIRVIEDPETAQRLAAAARDSCERYRWAVVRSQWLWLYQRLLKATGTVAVQRVRNPEITGLAASSSSPVLPDADCSAAPSASLRAALETREN
jgi:glycosyltransferase involved in cell wall biosynthesis